MGRGGYIRSLHHVEISQDSMQALEAGHAIPPRLQSQSGKCLPLHCGMAGVICSPMRPTAPVGALPFQVPQRGSKSLVKAFIGY
jgi:hypothetical protein